MTRRAPESVEAQAKRYRNRAHEGAFLAGARARWLDQPRATCPYPLSETVAQRRPTWTHAFRAAWRAGWDAQAAVDNEAMAKALRKGAR